MVIAIFTPHPPVMGWVVLVGTLHRLVNLWGNSICNLTENIDHQDHLTTITTSTVGKERTSADHQKVPILIENTTISDTTTPPPTIATQDMTTPPPTTAT
jgi:hypothetical protein